MASILVIDGHPNPQSLCNALADAYVEGARAKGADVQRLSVRDLAFDPILRVPYGKVQPLEPDLSAAQAAIEAARHVVIVTPLWWGSVPALLKGFFDRVLEKGWAYRYKANGMPERLLKGRSARVMMTTDSPGWYLWLLQGNPTRHQLVRSTLKFCGFNPVQFNRIGPVHSSKPDVRQQWLAEARQRGIEDAVKVSGR